jgi:dihydroorotate dehydrogenase
MGWIYDRLVRPVMFRLDAEEAHERAVAALAACARVPGAVGLLRAGVAFGAARPRPQPVECFGLRFPNRVGLAAGFDKNAVCWRAAAALGFGHVEVGTVTFQRQPGNPKPRLFRFAAEGAIINRMGFNNDGAACVAERLARQAPAGRRAIPLGVNLGKSKAAPLDEAVADYLASFALLADHADYVAVNVSSPNTPDLRRLQERGRLRELLGALVAANAARPVRRPLLLKIAPDLTFPQIDDVLGLITELKLDGVIATNTTLARPGRFAAVTEAGGLSGRPLRPRATEVVRYIAQATGGRLPIVGVGGIDDPESAGEKIDAGATLVQFYTGWVFRGPLLARELARALAMK